MNHIDFPAPESALRNEAWADLLDLFLDQLDIWLSDPINIHDAIASVESVLIEKHHDYGEDNLRAFGELGILVRASDKIARLKNLIDKQALVAGESIDDTWRDLAGYALQAMIMRKQLTLQISANTEKVNYFEIRKYRLIRGVCPDCGEGVLIKSGYELWNEDRLCCSKRCGFIVTYDLVDPYIPFTDFQAMLNYIAAKGAVREQK